MRRTTGWRSFDPASNALTRVTLDRRDLRPDDIAVRIDHCGVCHSDLHRIHGMLGEKNLVPGHEATGVVVATGEQATRFRTGDRVAIGTIVDSCGTCAMCRAGQENYCHEGPTTTYGGTDRIDGTPTLGAYSREYVLRETFAFRLPEALDPAAATPRSGSFPADRPRPRRPRGGAVDDGLAPRPATTGLEESPTPRSLTIRWLVTHESTR